MTATLAEAESRSESVSNDLEAVLIEQFVAEGDEAAFHELVARHGPLVMGVCLRVLGHREDAEDAFQAAFIVLAKRAYKIRKRDSVAAWLYGVAYRVSIDLARKRRRTERPLVSEPMQTEDPFTKLEHEFDRQVVDEELQRLPERYRTPLVLFYMGGKTSREIAEELGRSQGTIDGQLKRGRQQLRLRLTRRGVAMAGLLSVIAVSAEQATAAVSTSFVSSTASLALASASGAPIPGAVPSETSQLAARELLRMSLIKPLTLTLCAGLAVVVGTVCVNAFEGPANGNTTAALNTVLPGQGGNQSETLLTLSEPQQANLQSGPSTTTTSPGGGGRTISSSSQGGDSGQEQITVAAAARQAHAAIEEKLAAKSEPIQGDQTLQDVLDFVAEVHKIQIVVDRTALDEIGAPDLSEMNVNENFTLKNVRLGNALQIVFTQLDNAESGLDFILENEVMKITSRDRADQYRETRVYDLSRLTTADVATDELEQMIPEMTSFDMDLDDDVALRVVGRRLIVRHNQRIHRQIVDLLAQLKVPVGP